MNKIWLTLLMVLSISRTDAQPAPARVRPPVKNPTCESMPTVGRTIGELCTSGSDNSLRYWNGAEWVIIGTAAGAEFTDGCRWVHQYATGGDGTSTTPWTGWAEQILSGGSGNYCFAPGYYDQEEVYWESSVDNVHIKCEPGATFLRKSATGGFFRSEDSDAGNGNPSSVSITNFSIEGCTFDYNNIATGTVGGAYNRDATLGLWRTTGMHSNITIRNNKWINFGNVSYTYYSTRPDSALISIYAGRRILLEDNKTVDETFDASGHFEAFLWATSGEDIVVHNNEFYQSGLLKFESYNWQLWGNTQKDMRRVLVSNNKFTNVAVTNMIFRNTCIIAGDEGPTSIHDITVANNISTVTDYQVAGKGLVGVAATWAPDEFCTTDDGPIYSENVLIANNQMRGMRGNFIALGGEGTAHHWGAVKNVTIIGNVADGSAPGEAQVPEDCDYENVNGLCNSFGVNSNAVESSNLTIIGNTFKNLYYSCIYIYGKNVSITGNTCENSVRHEYAPVFYINAGIVAAGGSINITGNTIKNTGQYDHTLDGTNAFRVKGIFVPALTSTHDIKISDNLIIDERDHDIDGDSTIDDTDFDGTTSAVDKRAMDYGIQLGTGGTYGRYIQVTNNQILGAITQPWWLAITPNVSVIFGNTGNLRKGALEIAPEVNEVGYGFDTSKTACLSVTKDLKIFEDTDCDGIQDVNEVGVSDPTPLNSQLYSLGDEADTQPSMNPYILSGTAVAKNGGQSYTSPASVASAQQMYETTSGADMMVNVTGATDTSNIYSGINPIYPFSLNFGATVQLNSPKDSAYLVGFVRTDTDKDIYTKTQGVFYWCDPSKDVDGDGTAGDEDTDGTCGEAGEDDNDCDWYAASMGGDGTNDIGPDYSTDDSGGVLADATYTTITDTGVSCTLDPADEEFQNLSIIFVIRGTESYADYYIDSTLVASHNYSDDNMPGAWRQAFVGIWAQTNSTTQTGFAWDFVGVSGYRRYPGVWDEELPLGEK